MIEKFGFELENYGKALREDFVYSDDFHDHLYSLFVDDYGLNYIETVKGDGSLSRGGFEVNNGVFNGFDDFKNALMELNNICNDEGFNPKSPCAIHIHISNHQKPVNFSMLCHSFDQVFQQIINKNHSQIDWRCREGLEFHNPRFNKCTTPQQFQEILYDEIITSVRGRTLRNRCDQTIEFRAIPYRSNPKYLESWLKLYEGLKKRANYLSFDRCKDLRNEILESNLEGKYEILRDITGLNDKQIFTLHNKINSNSKKTFKKIIQGGDYNNMELINPSNPIRDLSEGVNGYQGNTTDCQGISNFLDEQGFDHIIQYSNGFNVVMDHTYTNPPINGLEDVRMVHLITLNHLWDRLDPIFSFFQTPVKEMFEYCEGRGWL